MSREVNVGGRAYTIEPFNGRKAILAGRMVARIAKRVPGLLEADARFQRDYAAANAIHVTRAMALVEGWRERLANVTAEEWEQVNGEIVIPQPPSDYLRIGALFTEVFEAAEEEVLKLLALAVISNSDLAAAAKSGDVKQLLVDLGEELVDLGGLADLTQLASEVADQIRSEFAASGDALGKLRALWAAAPDETKTPASASSPPVTEPEANHDDDPSPSATPSSPSPSSMSTSTPSSPDSSTASPANTDGGTAEPSTAPPGGSLSASPA